MSSRHDWTALWGHVTADPGRRARLCCVAVTLLALIVLVAAMVAA